MEISYERSRSAANGLKIPPNPVVLTELNVKPVLIRFLGSLGWNQEKIDKLMPGLKFFPRGRFFLGFNMAGSVLQLRDSLARFSYKVDLRNGQVVESYEVAEVFDKARNEERDLAEAVVKMAGGTGGKLLAAIE